jgi:membrane-bound ClpP family serine protease|tara:strand:+ start:1750 stop:2214 length:465 start_codon:yes stop_codon:yes gene_type:complete
MEALVIFFLILIGVILLIIEILFIPGTTIFGIFGIISIIASNYLFLQYFGPEYIIYFMLGSSILVLFIIIYSLKSKTWKKVSLQNIHTDKVIKNKNDKINIGDIGITISVLKPYGKGEFNDLVYEIKSVENYIDENKKIKIIDILQDKILVKKI